MARAAHLLNRAGAADSPPGAAGTVAQLHSLQRQQSTATPTRSNPFAMLRRSATMAAPSAKDAPLPSPPKAAPATQQQQQQQQQPAAVTDAPAAGQPAPTPAASPAAAEAPTAAPEPPSATAPDLAAPLPRANSIAGAPPAAPPAAAAAAALAAAAAATAGAAGVQDGKRDLKATLLPHLGPGSEVEAISALRTTLAMHAQVRHSTPGDPSRCALQAGASALAAAACGGVCARRASARRCQPHVLWHGCGCGCAAEPAAGCVHRR